MEYKFSVLMSVYYKEIPEYLDLALRSIIDNQLLKPNEIVLVKDGPLTKELDFIIQKYQNKNKSLFKIITLKKNEGLGKALNIGLDYCSNDLVARMDGDDISKPERFLEQIEVFKKNPEIDVVGSWIDEFETIENTFKIRSIRIVPEKHECIYKKLKSVCVFNHPTVMYRKSKVIEAGSYNQEFKLEDYYLWIRLAINECKFYNIQKSLLNFRVTKETSKRRGGIKLLVDDYKFQNKLLELNYINRYEFFKNISIRFIYRIIPAELRSYLQKKIYREEKK